MSLDPGGQIRSASYDDERLKKRWVFLRWILLLCFFLFAVSNMWTNFETLEEERAISETLSENEKIIQHTVDAKVGPSRTKERMTSAAADHRVRQTEL